MLKVCHVTSVHRIEDVRIFHKECSSLAKNGYEVYLVAKGDTYEKNGVHILGVDMKGSSRMKRMTDTVNKIKEKAIEINADVYHLHDPELLICVNQFKKMGKIVICDFHEDVGQQIFSKKWIPSYLRGIVSKIYSAYEKKICKNVDYIIAATPHIRDKFKTINPNVIDINNYPLWSEIDLQDDMTTEKQDILCYVGGISALRGVDKVVSAMEKVQGKLLMAGPLIETYRDQLEMIKEGWKKTEYLGVVDRQALREIFRRSKAGIVTFLPEPNHIESQPNKMFEYMSAGLPVICSNFPLWRDIVEKNNCGICVDPNNVEEIATAISYILKNPEEAESMGKRGKNMIIKKYNWDVEEKKLVELYEQFQKVTSEK